eukprot:6154945-Lingulodinium_polyedra.AAC.1
MGSHCPAGLPSAFLQAWADKRACVQDILVPFARSGFAPIRPASVFVRACGCVQASAGSSPVSAAT